MGTADGEFPAGALSARIADLDRRVGELERWREELATELRTRRLVVAEMSPETPGAARIVAEVHDRRAELRLEQPGSHAPHSTDVVLFADPGGADPGDADLGGGQGLQLWAEGEVMVELNLWRDGEGGWTLDAGGLPAGEAPP